MKKLDLLRQEPITFELDIPYADTDNPRQRLDLYLPTERKREKLPVIAFIHGGGWQHGDKSAGMPRLMPLLRTGRFAGVSIGYRLTDEAQWPAQIHDCKAAIRWVRANAPKYGLDPNYIGAWGTSAGGHLVLMLGTSGDVPDLEGNLGAYKGASSRVNAVVNFFGVAEFGRMVGMKSNIDRRGPDAPEAKLLGGPIPENPDKARAASPITYITSDDPPILTVHGSADPVVPYDQAIRLDTALKKANVPSYFITAEGAGHGTFGNAADDRVMAFFDKYLHGKNIAISTKPLKK